MNYELVRGMKVKTCINPERWGARMDLDFPRIYVWNCNNIKRAKCYKNKNKNELKYIKSKGSSTKKARIINKIRILISKYTLLFCLLVCKNS